MNPAWQSLPSSRSHQRRNLIRAFTRIEIILSLMIAGLAILLVFSAIHRVGQQVKYRQWESELRGFAVVFAEYRSRQGHWPETPKELGPRLTDLGWSRGSPFGGDYSWKPPVGADQPGLIGLTAFHPTPPLTLTQADLTEVDHHLDDGNLATGRFRTGFNGWPVYQVRKNP